MECTNRLLKERHLLLAVCLRQHGAALQCQAEAAVGMLISGAGFFRPPLVECECIPYFPHLCFHKCRVLPTRVTPNPQCKSYLWLQECILMEISTINIKMSCGKKKPIGKEIRKKINQQQHKSTLYDHVFSPNWLPQRPIGCTQGGTGNTTSLSLSLSLFSVSLQSQPMVSLLITPPLQGLHPFSIWIALREAFPEVTWEQSGRSISLHWPASLIPRNFLRYGQGILRLSWQDGHVLFQGRHQKVSQSSLPCQW